MRHLGVVLTIKLVLLAALWFVFVRGERVAVDPAVMAQRAGLPMLEAQSPLGEHRE
jgi:cbb3-type cytochrome oxidase subunit 3